MLLLFLILIPIILVMIRLILILIVRKYGKVSYDGFSAAGFAYNSEKDIFYSTKNAWQKNFGYTHMYDVLAPLFQMIVDTESIRFSYNKKNWLISFWKGQYGIVTGAEVGVYCTDQKKVNKKTVYVPVNDCEMLNMSFILYKKGEVITKVSAKHWWLAAFKLGMFSKPKDLSMDINITFLNHQMLESFLKSFRKLGYKYKDFRIIDNTFCFRYVKPRTRKVWTRFWLFDKIRQFMNRKNVELYNTYFDGLIDDDGMDDSKMINHKNLLLVNKFIPDLLKNSSEDLKEKKILIQKVGNDKKSNVVFLDYGVSYENRVNYYE